MDAPIGGAMIDWNLSPDVERVPGKMSGEWVIRGTRIPVQAVLDNADDFTPEEIVTTIYPSLPLERAQRVIAFARRATHAPAAG